MASSVQQFDRNAIKCGAVILLVLQMLAVQPSHALPPASDIPEEVLRARPIAIGRSAVDNSLLSPSEYEQLQAELAEAQETRPTISPRLRRLITLLRLRKLLRTLNPLD